MSKLPNNDKVLAVIPARAGSTEVPRKNLLVVEGKPIIAYMIEAARRSRHITRLIVSTESDEIAEVARRFGAEVPFVRPLELATSEVPLTPVTIHAMKKMDELGFRADVIVLLQPTSPLTCGADIDAAIEKLWETECDSVVSVKKIEECHPWRAYQFIGDRMLPFNEYTNERLQQRQDRPPAHKFSGAIYVRRRHLLEAADGEDFALGRDVRGVLIPSERAIDINSRLDLLLFKAILKANATTA